MLVIDPRLLGLFLVRTTRFADSSSRLIRILGSILGVASVNNGMLGSVVWCPSAVASFVPGKATPPCQG